MPACGPAEASPWAGDVSEGTLVSSSGPYTPAGVRIRRSSRRDPGGGGRRRAACAAPGRLTAITAGLALGISIMPMNSSNPGHLAADISNVPGSFLSMRSKYRDAVYPAPEA